jgi:hypothetical protein
MSCQGVFGTNFQSSVNFSVDPLVFFGATHNYSGTDGKKRPICNSSGRQSPDFQQIFRISIVRSPPGIAAVKRGVEEEP